MSKRRILIVLPLPVLAGAAVFLFCSNRDSFTGSALYRSHHSVHRAADCKSFKTSERNPQEQMGNLFDHNDCGIWRISTRLLSGLRAVW